MRQNEVRSLILCNRHLSRIADLVADQGITVMLLGRELGVHILCDGFLPSTERIALVLVRYRNGCLILLDVVVDLFVVVDHLHIFSQSGQGQRVVLPAGIREGVSRAILGTALRDLDALEDIAGLAGGIELLRATGLYHLDAGFVSSFLPVNGSGSIDRNIVRFVHESERLRVGSVLHGLRCLIGSAFRKLVFAVCCDAGSIIRCQLCCREPFAHGAGNRVGSDNLIAATQLMHNSDAAGRLLGVLKGNGNSIHTGHNEGHVPQRIRGVARNLRRGGDQVFTDIRGIGVIRRTGEGDVLALAARDIHILVGHMAGHAGVVQGVLLGRRIIANRQFSVLRVERSGVLLVGVIELPSGIGQIQISTGLGAKCTVFTGYGLNFRTSLIDQMEFVGALLLVGEGHFHIRLIRGDRNNGSHAGQRCNLVALCSCIILTCQCLAGYCRSCDHNGLTLFVAGQDLTLFITGKRCAVGIHEMNRDRCRALGVVEHNILRSCIADFLRLLVHLITVLQGSKIGRRAVALCHNRVVLGNQRSGGLVRIHQFDGVRHIICRRRVLIPKGECTVVRILQLGRALGNN